MQLVIFMVLIVTMTCSLDALAVVEVADHKRTGRGSRSVD